MNRFGEGLSAGEFVATSQDSNRHLVRNLYLELQSLLGQGVNRTTIHLYGMNMDEAVLGAASGLLHEMILALF